MLVLSRKNEQSVVIGGSDHFAHMLKVTVLEIGHGKVRLGFEANKDVPVHRAEVWERLRVNGRVERPVEIAVAPRPCPNGRTGGVGHVEKTHVQEE